MEREKRIALLVDYISTEYSEELIGGVSDFCKENKLSLLILPCGRLNYNDKGYVYQYVAINSLLNKNNVDGVICTSGTQMHCVSPNEFRDYIKSFNIPACVNISMEMEGIPSVLVDAEKAFGGLVDYMIEEQGCKKLLLMGVDSTSYEVQERTRLFWNSVERHKLNKRNCCELKAMFNYVTAKEELDSYFEKKKKFDFDGIVALNDDMAFACIDFCRKLGLKVPEDVVVSGFDDLPRAAFSYLTLTSVNQQLRQQGYTAAEKVFALMKGETVNPVTKIPAKTVLRSSTKRNPYLSGFNDTDTFRTEGNDSNLNVKFPVYEWYTKRNQLYMATLFYADLQQDMTIVQLKKVLNRELPNFDISTVAIVIYDQPVEKTAPFTKFDMPEKASVIVAYDKKTNFEFDIYDDIFEFNPNESLLPKQISYFIRNDTICISLFQSTVQYGYMVFNRGTFDSTVYDILSKAISSLVASVFSFRVAHEESERFKKRWLKTDQMAQTDELTGIKNRRYFFDLGNATMTFADTVSQEGLVIYCDMDGLKKINDNYGHDAGDKAIQAEAKILSSNFRTNDVVARIAGDEFAIICQGITESAFEKIKKNIEEDCVKWTMESGSPFLLSISLGAIKFPSEKGGYNLDKLLSEADHKLYQEKKRKKSAWKKN